MAPRRNAGFVSKRAHKKSRGGCSTCKKKKVKCDEGQPACAYCALRKLECIYRPDPQKDPSTSFPDYTFEEAVDFSKPLDAPLWLMPAVQTSSGHLNATELKFLHHYKNSVWPEMSLQQNDAISSINRDWVPQMSISCEHILYSTLSISAMHLHASSPQGAPEAKNLSLMYRQRALSSYNKALTHITSDNYESLLLTSMWVTLMVPPPTLPCSDDACLAWTSALFTMMQGLRILASLRWASGIERLTVYPLLRRELKKLPPPPMLTPLPEWLYYKRRQGDEFLYPNSPGDTLTDVPSTTTDYTYDTPSPPAMPVTPQSAGVHIDTSNLPFQPQKLMSASTPPHAPLSWKAAKPTWELPAPAFLPPPLMALLYRLVDPVQTGAIDLLGPILIPVLHGLSPIFLSLYYYHLSQDVHVRIFVLPTFLTAEFLALAREREPRALVLVGWYFALLILLPQTNKWFPQQVLARVLQSVSNLVMRCGDGVLMDAMEGAYRIVRTEIRVGKEAAARTVFEGWEGVNWEEGPEREEQWRMEELCRVSEIHIT